MLEDYIFGKPVAVPEYKFAQVTKLNPFTILPDTEDLELELGSVPSLVPLSVGDQIFYQVHHGYVVILGKVHTIT